MIYTPIDEQIKYNSNNNIPKFYQYNEYSIPSYYDQFTSIPYINTKLNNHEDSVLNDNSNLYNNEESTISNNPLSFDFPFIHPRDTKDFTPFLLNNVPVDWLRSEDNDIILSDLGNEISPPTYQVKMVVELQETLFNRLQWYHVVCKFLDEDGSPAFCGRNFVLDQSVKFVDGRRRTNFKPLDNAKEGPVYISVEGLCASTGKNLLKCKRCKEKDKNLRKRKRKRQENSLWNEMDEENNDKLIQLHSTGERIIDEQGELRFRIRIGCCVGVSKQHHINHIANEGQKLEIHKNCEGMILIFKADYDTSSLKYSMDQPIRILGKVTETERQKCLNTIHHEEDILSHEADIEEVGNIFNSSRNFVGCSSCAAIGDKELFTSTKTSPIVKPSILIRHFIKTFKSLFHNVFTKKQLENMCNDSFFINPPLEKFDDCTPSMLQILTILAVGACMSGYLGTADKFWEKATQLANILSNSKFKEKYDALLFADGLNRVSFYYGSGSDPIQGAYYSEKAYQCLSELSLYHADVLDLDVYETTLWSRMTFTLDMKTLDYSYQWALKKNNLEIMTFSLFLKVITCLLPDLREYILNKIERLDLLENDINQTDDDCIENFNNLKLLFKRSEYYTASCGNHTYGKLIDDGFECFENWINGDKAKALDKARSAAIQCSLFEHPQYPLLIPTYLTCTVCVWISETRHPSSYPYLDYAELCIKSFSRVSHYRWVRIIVDYFIKKIDVISGRCIEMNTCPLRDKSKKPNL